MKLATFTENQSTRLGIVKNDRVIDLSQTVSDLPQNMREFLEAGDHAMARVREVAQSTNGHFALSEVKLEAPVINPRKILAIGLNYMDHIKETGRKPPEHQMWFNKQHNAINGPYDPIQLPSVSEKTDYEAELCMVIGKHCKHVPRERAHEVVAGYFCGNDVSVRDWQAQSPTFQIGKSFDTHATIGPWIVTSDEVGDPHDLDIKTLVNGEVRQNSNTKHLVFDCFDQIAHLTKAFPLDPGDILFTGTSSGVGFAMDPPQYLQPGDVVRIEIEKLGYIENKTFKEDAQTIIR